jgi:hypothetical protein
MQGAPARRAPPARGAWPRRPHVRLARNACPPGAAHLPGNAPPLPPCPKSQPVPLNPLLCPPPLAPPPQAPAPPRPAPADSRLPSRRADSRLQSRWARPCRPRARPRQGPPHAAAPPPPSSSRSRPSSSPLPSPWLPPAPGSTPLEVREGFRRGDGHAWGGFGGVATGMSLACGTSVGGGVGGMGAGESSPARASFGAPLSVRERGSGDTRQASLGGRFCLLS